MRSGQNGHAALGASRRASAPSSAFESTTPSAIRDEVPSRGSNRTSRDFITSDPSGERKLAAICSERNRMGLVSSSLFATKPGSKDYLLDSKCLLGLGQL